MRLGVLADTHDRLDPRVASVFQGVDRILHAGDVCQPTVIAELEVVAPVTVVAGNNDYFPGWRETEVLEVGGCRILLEHIVNPHAPTSSFRIRLQRFRPDLVIFGHTHRPFNEPVEGIFYLNPGSAGAPRYGLKKSVCLLTLSDGPTRIRPDFVTLD